MDDGDPIYGLAVHAWDFDYMVRNNDDIREDMRYANAKVLIENFGKVKLYRGFAIVHDIVAPRFEVKSITASTMTLKRVEPFTTEATTVGSKPVINPDYISAEYALGIIFLNDVFEMMVPPAGPASPGGGTQFGAQPSLNGEFMWLNIQDRCENALREKGYYFGRYEVFNKPLEYSDEPIAFLYKRCPQNRIKLCEPCSETGTGWIVITAATELIEESDESANNVRKVEITLAECLSKEAPAELSIDYSGADSSDVTAVVVDDSEAPTYKIAFTAKGDWVAAGTIVANTTTVSV